MVLAIIAAALPAATTEPDAPVVLRIGFDTDPAAGPRYFCIAQADNPHWSAKERGGTVLIKTRVTCTGPTEADVRVVGTLSSSPQEAGPYKNRHSSDETRRNLGDGRKDTFYTPKEGEPTVRGSAWYRATIVRPVPSGPWTAHSNAVWVKTP